MTHRFNGWLMALLLLVVLPGWWLLIENDASAIAARPLPLADLRALARAMPGPHPDAVEVEVAARRMMPGSVLAAGLGLKWRTVAIAAWRLPVAGKGAVVIGSGISADDAAERGFDRFDAGAQARIMAARDRAGLAIALDSPGAPTEADLRPRALAPGVVLVPAPGHGPASRLVFVVLADGREYLFAGGTSPLSASWRQVRARSRLLGEWRHHEDRAAVFGWLKAIRALSEQAPTLTVVPGLDGDWNDSAIRWHRLRAGFGQ